MTMERGPLMKRVGGALAVGLVGLTMVVWALERTSLINFDRVLDGGDGETPLRIYTTMFVGLAVLSLCVFYAFNLWSQYLREHPDSSQLPVWFLVLLVVVPGAALVTSVATHAGYVRGLDDVPMDPNPGYVAFQVVAGALVIIALVLLSARFAPGYKRPAPRGPQ